MLGLQLVFLYPPRSRVYPPSSLVFRRGFVSLVLTCSRAVLFSRHSPSLLPLSRSSQFSGVPCLCHLHGDSDQCRLSPFFLFRDVCVSVHLVPRNTSHTQSAIFVYYWMALRNRHTFPEQDMCAVLCKAP